MERMDEDDYWTEVFERVGPLSSAPMGDKPCAGVDHTCPPVEEVTLKVTHVAVPCGCGQSSCDWYRWESVEGPVDDDE